MSLLDSIKNRIEGDELVLQLRRIADALDRAFPPNPMRVDEPKQTEEPPMYIADDEATYDFEIEDQIEWLKGAQPQIFDEIRQKLSQNNPQ